MVTACSATESVAATRFPKDARPWGSGLVLKKARPSASFGLMNVLREALPLAASFGKPGKRGKRGKGVLRSRSETSRVADQGKQRARASCGNHVLWTCSFGFLREASPLAPPEGSRRSWKKLNLLLGLPSVSFTSGGLLNLVRFLREASPLALPSERRLVILISIPVNVSFRYNQTYLGVYSVFDIQLALHPKQGRPL